MIPAHVNDPIHFYMGLAALLALAAGYLLYRWAKRRQMATGRQFPIYKSALGLLIGFPLIAWLIGGAPSVLEAPELRGCNFRGGLGLLAEHVAVRLGLCVATAH